MPKFTPKLNEFINNRYQYLREIKTPTEQQQMFLELAGHYLDYLSGQQTPLNPAEERALKTLADAEKAAEKAAEAKRAVRRLVSAENEKARKERTHNMINAAGLMSLAGLLDKKTGKPLTSNERLLGALAELAKREPTDAEKAAWDEAGAALLRAGKRTD